MAATITLRLKDQASPGLANFEDALAGAGQSSARTADDMDRLTAAQERQLTVIHEHRGAWLQFAGNVLYAGATMFSVYGKMQQTAMWTNTLRDGLAGIGSGARSAGAQLATMATRGGTALKVLGRIGVVGGVVGVGLAGAALGAVAVSSAVQKMSERLQQSANATEDQKRQFEQLKTEANALQISLTEAAARSGVSLESLAVTAETSYSRIKDAAEDLGDSITRQALDTLAAYGQVGMQLVGVEDAFQNVEKTVKTSTDRLVENLEYLQKLSDQWADFRLGDGYAEVAREQAKWNEQLEETQENFSRLRKANAAYDDVVRQGAAARKLQAITTLQAIDEEVRGEQERAGLLAAQRKLTEQEQTAYFKRLEALERRRTQIVDEQSRERARLERERQEASLKEQAKRQEEYLKQSREAYERHQKILAQRDAAERDWRFALNREIVNDAIAALEREGADAETIHEAKLRLIEQERNQAIAATDDQFERERILFESERKLLQADSAFRRDQLRKQVDDERQAAEEKLRIRKELHDRLRGQLEGQGITGESVLQQQDQRKVLEMLQARRRAAAEQAFRQSEEGQRMSAEANTGSQANARFKARLRAVNRQSDIDAFRDARAGNLNPGELQQAQADAARQQLQAMQQNGKLSSDVVQVLTQQAQAAAQQQATMDILQQQVEALGQQARGQQRAAAGTRQRAQRGSLGQ